MWISWVCSHQVIVYSRGEIRAFYNQIVFVGVLLFLESTPTEYGQYPRLWELKDHCPPRHLACRVLGQNPP